MLQRTLPALLVASLLAHTVCGFTTVPSFATKQLNTKTQLHMGLFDGVKDAFSAPALERSTIASERETPIDRWFGWSVTSQDDIAKQKAMTEDFVDSMDVTNYVAVVLEKPMGIVFEENDEQYGGIFVQSLKEDGVAAKDGTLKVGDQLVSVQDQKVAGYAFEDALNVIVESPQDKIKLVLFRGTAKQLYGPTGASKEWLDEFVSKGGVEASSTA